MPTAAREERGERPDLVGRDDEVTVVREFLAARRDHPSVLLIEGEAGSGKTTLVREAAAQAERLSYLVLAAGARESETTLSYAALSDLMSAVFDDFSPALPEPQRRALAVALLREDPDERPPGRWPVAAGLLSLLRALAPTGSVVITIDDVSWLDRPSADALELALRRLAEPSVKVVMSRRPDEQTRLPVGLDALPDGRVRVLRLEPLSVGALQRILRTRLNVTFPRPVLRRIHETAGGNPLYALELARHLSQRGGYSTMQPFPVPPSLGTLLEQRLETLPGHVRTLLLAVAALSTPTLVVVRAAVADRINLGDALDTALDEGVLEADGELLRFTHPLLASAVRSGVSRAAWRAMHRRLAAVVADPEERARHLALAIHDADETVARILDHAAELAAARGAPQAAAELADRAADLTPAQSREARQKRVVAAAEYHFEAGDGGRAIRLLSDAVHALPAGPRRADVLGRIARFHMLDAHFNGGAAAFAEALAQAGTDPLVCARIEEGLAWALLLNDDVDSAAVHSVAAVDLAEHLHDDTMLAEALAVTGLVGFARGRGVPTDIMQRALRLEPSTRHLRILRHPSYAFAGALVKADEIDRGRSMLDDLMRRAEDHGDESAVALLHYHLSWAQFLAGNWTEARRHAAEGYDAALAAGQRPQQAFLLGLRALVEAHLGNLAEAHTAILIGRPITEELDLHGARRLGLWADAFVERTLGNFAGALQRLRPLVQPAELRRVRDPGERRFVPLAVEALIGLGHLEEAGELLADFQAQAAALDRASALAVAARCRGLLRTACGDPVGAVDHFERALLLHQGAREPFEVGRTLFALGATLRSLNRRSASREAIDRSVTLFRQVGASRWVGLAEAERSRLGGRTASPRELTGTQGRVADLVSHGLTNKEVAARLVVSVRAVEANLSKIYAKLGLRSRAELIRHLADRSNRSPTTKPCGFPHSAGNRRHLP